MMQIADWKKALQEYIVEDRAPYGYSGHDYVTGEIHLERVYKECDQPYECIVALIDLIPFLVESKTHEGLRALESALLFAKRISHIDLYNCIRNAFASLSVPADDELRPHRIIMACTALAAIAHIEIAVGTIQDRSFWESLIAEKNELSITAYFQFSKVDLAYAIKHFDFLFDSDMVEVEKVVGLHGLQREAAAIGFNFDLYLSDFLKRRPECKALCRQAFGEHYTTTSN